ncbi:hypothetical protein [Mycobacterium botniense]|uniref:Twin-arginine translocation pathway signal n=1 Tax=Mycobacterium botniense TaxID=84962 RepID=A0A7I9XZH8_9MYCO|nr:hypothetical protein MBOT_25860 [Mycobacterium botniense]
MTINDKTDQPTGSSAETGTVTTEVTDVSTATAQAERSRPIDSVVRRLRRVKISPVVLILLLAVSAGLATWLYFHEYRPDRQTDQSVARAVCRAASDGTVALLSYAPESLDRDFATAKSHLTGDFLSYYDQFTQQIVAPAAKQKSLKTTAHVMRAAVAELHPNSAVVLVFVDQSTTSKDNPDPSMAASSVLVTLTKINGSWLITKFDPV